MTSCTVLKQYHETYEKMELVKDGKAKMCVVEANGLMRYIFSDSVMIEFKFISSFMCFHELLANTQNFPYPNHGKNPQGVYELFGSSYLQRIARDEYLSGSTFRRHKHYVYWDDFLCYHITCGGISVSETKLK